MTHPGGRPSSYTSAIADCICERMALGESVRSICSDVEMPGLRTVYQWLEKDSGFAHQYARAIEDRAAYMAERTIQEAEAAVGMDAAGVAAQRLLVDTLKWQASKLAPKKYGDRQIVEGPGANGEHTIKTTTAELSDEQLSAIAAQALLKK